MAAPLVSICVPTFNGAPWLAECLASASVQTLADFEVLVVDDASDDATLDVAMEFAAGDRRVRVERNPQRLGLASNWNRCLDLARGKWFKFLFQDDVLAPSCLARMTAVAEGVSLVVCDRRVDMSEDTPPSVRAYFANLPKLDALFPAGDRVSEDRASGDRVSGARVAAVDVARVLCVHPGVNVFGEPSAVLMHRDVRRFGGFNPDMIQLCDLEFFVRVASNEGFVRVPEELATFRVHGRATSATNRGAREFQKDVLDTLILLHEYAFAAEFAALRRVARGVQPAVSFSALAAQELRRARRDCRATADPEMRQALDRVLAAYPNLARPLWQLWHRVRKHVRPS